MIFHSHQESEWRQLEHGMRQRPNGHRVLRLLRELAPWDGGPGRRLWRDGVAVVAATLVALAMLAGTPTAQAMNRSSYELGLEAAENYRYGEALMHFQRAAEQGDRNARRNLGLMLLYGDLLYGKEVPRNQEQARRWLQSAAGAGCEVSTFMLKLLAQHGR